MKILTTSHSGFGTDLPTRLENARTSLGMIKVIQKNPHVSTNLADVLQMRSDAWYMTHDVYIQMFLNGLNAGCIKDLRFKHLERSSLPDISQSFCGVGLKFRIHQPSH